MIAVSRREVFDYVLEEDRELLPEQQTLFKLRPLTLKQSIPIEDELGKHAASGGLPMGTFNYKVLKAGLVGWENLVDDNGQPLVFSTGKDGVEDELLERFTTAQRTELANAIWQRAKPTDDDAKN
jgi:hypothetical protein